jgi:hypothetical protein
VEERYAKAGLIERFGADIALPDLLTALGLMRPAQGLLSAGGRTPPCAGAALTEWRQCPSCQQGLGA